MRSLKLQLLFSHLLLVFLMLIVMMSAIFNFVRLGGSIDRILRDNYASVVAAQDMKEALERQDSAATFCLSGEVARARDQYQKFRPQFIDAYQRESHNITEPGEQELANAIGIQDASYRRALEHLLYSKPALTRRQANDDYYGTLEPAFARLRSYAQGILTLNQQAILRADARAKSEARGAAITTIGITIGAFVLALFFALRMIRASLTPLRSLARQAEEIGAGHWNQRIELRRDDEIGALAASFNQMAEKLGLAWQQEARRLHRAERMSDAALESLYDPVIVTDAMGRIIHLNRAAEGLFGSEEGVTGQSVVRAIRDTRIAEAVNRAIHQERVSAAEDEAGLVTLQSDSDQRTYRLRATPMRDDDGSLLGATAVLEDVTHLRELDRLKSEFIGVASHELRTPVTSLLLSVQLLDEGAAGPLSPEQREIVSAQREDLDRLQRMMRDLLDVTRLEAGVTPPRFEIVTVSELTVGSARAVSAQADAKGVALSVETDPGLPPVRADRGQIQRVLVNLLNNAIQHTPAGGQVRLQAQRQDARVLFRVQDTGVGIPADYLPHIFERFVQVPGATRGGAGLGLSIAQTIVKAHQGVIEARSDLGKGSTFTFALPTAEELPASAARA